MSDQFLSVTIDSGAIASDWDHLNLKSMSVINMGKALAPAMLRIGGTSEDFVIFKNLLESSSTSMYSSNKPLNVKDRSNITLSASQWDAINQFTQEVGWEMVFGLNVFLRNPWPHGPWDTANAEELMRYTISKGYKVNWELGNGMYSIDQYIIPAIMKHYRAKPSAQLPKYMHSYISLLL